MNVRNLPCHDARILAPLTSLLIFRGPWGRRQEMRSMAPQGTEPETNFWNFEPYMPKSPFIPAG